MRNISHLISMFPVPRDWGNEQNCMAFTSTSFSFIHLTTQSFSLCRFFFSSLASGFLGASTVVQQLRESCCTHIRIRSAIIHTLLLEEQRKNELLLRFLSKSAFIDYCCFFRNAGNAVLHPLLAVKDDRAQNGHFQIFRFGHFRGDWSQCHYYGHGILHDAQGNLFVLIWGRVLVKVSCCVAHFWQMKTNYKILRIQTTVNLSKHNV